MNHWTLVTDPLAPWNIPETMIIECNNCHEPLNGAELADPIKIKGEYYCDYCTSEITRLGFRCRTVNQMTTDLRSAVNFQRLHEQEYDKLGKVKHI